MPYLKTRARLTVAAVFLLSALLVACGPQAPAPLPTRTPMPTFTPAPPPEQAPVEAPPAVEQSPAEQPSAEQPPAEQPTEEEPPAQQEETGSAPEAPTPVPDPPTPEPSPEVVINSTINVRGGPGTNYNIIGAANAGQRFPVTGRNQDASWWQINYNGQAGWVFNDLVTTQATSAVAVAQNIPAPPPPTATPIPQAPPPPPAEAPPPPAPEPEPEPQPEEPPPPPPQADFPFTVGEGRCDPNAGQTYFQGYVRDSSNNPVNGVCVHIHFYEPRGTKCSGCDGVGDGNWGFSPFGGPAPPGTPIEIFVVACEGPMPEGGQTAQSGFGNLTPQSPKWTRTIGESEQCTGITFYRR